jgi:hypothetical protein
MTTRHLTGMCLAVALSMSVGAAAQGTTGTQGAGQATETDRATTGAQHDRSGDQRSGSERDMDRQGDEARTAGRTVTVVGCVQSEREVFAQRGIFNDNVVLTQASAVSGDLSAFGRHEAGDHREAAAASVGPYDADRDGRRDDVIVQHDGTREMDREQATATSGAADRDRAGAQDQDRQQATAGTTGADADRDRQATTGTSGEATTAEGVTRDEDRHESTGAAGVAAQRPTGAYDANRDGDQRQPASPGTAAHHEDRYTADPQQPTTGTSGTADRTQAAEGGQFQDQQGRIFTLSGDKARELRDMIGRKVEVTGTVEYSREAVEAAAEADRQAGRAGEAAAGTTGQQDQGEMREQGDEGQARATNTGAGWVPGRFGASSPEEIAAADGRDRMTGKPQIEVTSFKDVGSCGDQGTER